MSVAAEAATGLTIGKPTRDAYGQALLDILRERRDVVVLDADLSRSTRTEWVDQRHPDRFFNMGIAEQNLFSVSAGLALSGLVPFATTYAIFIGRGYDQIRQSIAFSGCNVKIVATHAGLAASFDGGSHQGLEDIALMRVIPGMVVLSPADYHETYQAVFAALAHRGPVYLRLQKEDTPIVTPPNTPFRIGAATVLKDGRRIALIATGAMVAEALLAADLLDARGHSTMVVNVSTLKPIPADLLRDVARSCELLVTVEEHNIVGGLHEAVCAVVSGATRQPVAAIGVADCYGDTGSWRQLKEKHGLTAPQIAHRVKSLMERDGC